MGWERIVIIRDELYEGVWEQPMTKLAKTYGLSDVGLRKVCKKLQVPLPPQGYWARKYRGRPPALRSNKGPREHILHVWVEPEHELSSEQKTERECMLEHELQPQQAISITKPLDEPHKLVAKTMERLKKAASRKKSTDQSWLTAGTTGLGVRVSPPQIDRAMSIMNALLCALEQREMKANAKEGRTVVSVMGEKISFSLEEASMKVDHVPTSKEIKEQERYHWRKPPKYDHIPNGKLSLTIDTGYYSPRRAWRDGKNRRVEDRLNDFIVGLIKTAFEMKARRAEAERQERERLERERLRAEKIRLIKEEKAKLEQLETNTDRWHRSQQIRAYVEAVQKDAGPVVPESELSRWIEWATQQADRLDPLKESPPSVLDEENKYTKPVYW